MLTIATWNVESLFAPDDSDGPTEQQEYDTKIAGLAAMINAIGASIVGLQEVGSGDPLVDLISELDGEWNVVESTKPDSRQIRVAVISKLAFSDVVELFELPPDLTGIKIDDSGAILTRMGRGAIQVTVDVAGLPLTLLVCHLKSKLLTYPGGRFTPRDEDERTRYAVYALGRRAAEAAAIRLHASDVLNGDGQSRRFLVMGDLNDSPEAATTQLLLGPGGSEIGTSRQWRKDQGDAWRLWNLAPMIPSDHQFSRVYQGRHELIDHMLVSKALMESVGAVDSLIETPAGASLPSVDDIPGSRTTTHPSDHAPIVMSLNLG